MASIVFFWPIVRGVTLGFGFGDVWMRFGQYVLQRRNSSCFTTPSACAKSRFRTAVPALTEFSSSKNNCFARSTASAPPSSLIQPSRVVAFDAQLRLQRLQVPDVAVEHR